MASAAMRDEKIGVLDFLTLEMNAPDEERWELINGVIWRMMTGGTVAHNFIVQNLGNAIRARLIAKASPCWTASENVKLLDQPSELVAYPDLMVKCGPVPETSTSLSDPVLVAEVLSPGTRTKDVDRKGPAYRRIAALHTLLFVEQAWMHVEVYRRTADGFLLNTYEDPSDAIEIPELGITVPLAEIYRGLSIASAK